MGIGGSLFASSFFFSPLLPLGFRYLFRRPVASFGCPLRRAGLSGAEGKREEVGPAWRGGATGIASGFAHSASGSATGFQRFLHLLFEFENTTSRIDQIKIL